MNRRNFIQFLGLASTGSVVAYSFPNIIVPKNIIVPDIIDYSLITRAYERAVALEGEPLLVQREIYPQFINDFFFTESLMLLSMKQF